MEELKLKTNEETNVAEEKRVSKEDIIWPLSYVKDLFDSGEIIPHHISKRIYNGWQEGIQINWICNNGDTSSNSLSLWRRWWK